MIAFYRLVFFLIVLFSSLSLSSVHATLKSSPSKENSPDTFKVLPGLESQVNFWEKIYTQYTTDQVVIHDARNLDRIYEILNIKGKSPITQNRLAKKTKKKYKNILRKLGRLKNPAKLSKEEERVKNIVKKNFYNASKYIRSQLGQADRFKEGVERSGKYMDAMIRIFRRHDLPTELTVLPHVESSFQIHAYSKFGAAGVWQFTRSTGRLFMNVGYELDERRDPLISTEAAARLLKQNYKSLGSWPLAITAYNHGPNGMKRARKKHGDDIVKIISHYRSRTFGFASRNFYSEFLAALRVTKKKEKHFPSLIMAQPLTFDTVSLDHYYNFKSLANHLKISTEELAALNPSLRPSVINGEKRVPKTVKLKVPKKKGKEFSARLAQIPDNLKFGSQKRSKWYKVRRGDTLGQIAGRFRTSVSVLCQLNHIRSSKRIYVGQVLHLPQNSRTKIAQKTDYVPIKVKKLTGDTYKVRKNDSLYKIAKLHGVKTGSLLRFNGLQKSSLIYPGQVLNITSAKPPSSKLVVEKKVMLADASSSIHAERVIDGTQKIVKAMEPPVIAKVAFTKSPSSKPIVEKKVVLEDAPLNVNTEKVTDGTQKIVKAMALPVIVKVSLSEVEVSKHEESQRLLGSITVENDETLGHYAEWAEFPISEIRRLNRLRYNKPIKVGEKIEVVFRKVTPDQFEERRREYHHAIREDFYTNYEIIKTETIQVKPGQSLWEICRAVYGIPYWLLKDYNPEVDIKKLIPGQSLQIPVVNTKSEKRQTI